MTTQLLIYGGGGHALVIRDVLEQMEGFTIRAIVVDEQYMGSVRSELHDIVTCPASDVLELKDKEITHAIVAIGDNEGRMRVASRLRKFGFEMVRAIHPRAVVARSALVGSGTLIAAGAVIGVNARLGEDVIVNTCASVDHDCELTEGASLCPGARLAGGVLVGKGVTVGAGATVIDKIQLGSGAVIGAGAVVVEDVPERVLALGIPAKVTRSVGLSQDE